MLPFLCTPVGFHYKKINIHIQILDKSVCPEYLIFSPRLKFLLSVKGEDRFYAVSGKKKKEVFFFPPKRKAFPWIPISSRSRFPNAKENVLTSCYNTPCHFSRALAILISGQDSNPCTILWCKLLVSDYSNHPPDPNFFRCFCVSLGLLRAANPFNHGDHRWSFHQQHSSAGCEEYIS